MALFNNRKDKTSKNKNKSKIKMGWLDFWDNYYSQYVNKDFSEKRIERDHSLYGDFNSAMSGKHNISYIYAVVGYPKEMELSYITSLRRACKPGVRVNAIRKTKRDSINWGDPKIKRQTEIWDTIEKNTKPKNQGRNSSIYSSAQETARDNRTLSLMYLYDATKNRGRKLFLVQEYLIVAGKRGSDFDKSIMDIEKEAREIGIQLMRVSSNLSNFLRVISPTSKRSVKSVEDVLPNSVLPDEILSRFNTYDQGFTGTGSLMMGLSVRGQSTVLMEPKTSPTDAENYLIGGETGSGKSYTAKAYLEQLLARDDINGTINDIEGREYIGLAEFTARLEKVVIVDLTNGTGQYIDPVEMHLTGNSELDSQMYEITQSFTLSVLNTYLGEKLLNESIWASIMVKASVNKFYSNLGVLAEDQSTWAKTKGKTQFDIYPLITSYTPLGFIGIDEYIKQMNAKNHPINTKFLEERDQVIAELDIYLSNTAKHSQRYSNPINIKDLEEAKLVLVSFGMAGKAETSIDPVEMGLMQIYASQISYLRSIFSLNQGKYNVKVWEELQRWGDFPNSDEVLKVALSGGRKLGDINILIINRFKEVVDNDRFGILESVQHFAIGAIGEADIRAKLAKKLSIEHMLPELDLIAKSKAKEVKGEQYIERDYNTIMNKPYARAFVIGINKAEFTTAKIHLPKSLSETKLFQTGVEIKEAN